MPESNAVTVSTVKDVTIAKITAASILDSLQIERIGADLAALADNPLIPKIIVDLAAATHLSSAALGMLLRGRHHLPQKVAGRVPHWEPVGPKPKQGLELLLITSLIFPIALISLPNIPIFGGTKHWMPAMPYLALFAGIGASRFTEVAAHALQRSLVRIPQKAVQAALVIAWRRKPGVSCTTPARPWPSCSTRPIRCAWSLATM